MTQGAEQDSNSIARQYNSDTDTRADLSTKIVRENQTVVWRFNVSGMVKKSTLSANGKDGINSESSVRSYAISLTRFQSTSVCFPPVKFSAPVAILDGES